MPFAWRQVDDLRALGVEVKVLRVTNRTNPLEVLKGLRMVREFVRTLGPVVVHAHYGTTTAFIAMCSGAERYAVTFRGSDLNPYGGVTLSRRPLLALRGIIARAISQLTAWRADEIICVSEVLSKRLWRARDRERAHVVPSGVDTERFMPADRAQVRSGLGWDLESLYVVFNEGGRPAVKRRDRADAAVAHVRSLGMAATLIVLNGKLGESDIALTLQAANCVILCSDYEGSPNIVKEAMACGTRVVSTPVGDVPAHAARSVGVWVAEPNRLGAALAVALLQSGPTSGPEYVEQHLSSRRISSRLRDILVGMSSSPPR